MALVGRVEPRSFGVAPYHVLVVRCLLCGDKDEHVIPRDYRTIGGSRVVPRCDCYDKIPGTVLQPVRIIPND